MQKTTFISNHFILILSLFILFYSCSRTNEKVFESAINQDELGSLIAGNERFVHHHSIHPHQSIQRIKTLEKGQHPFAVVIGCSDSRVPPELVFDQGFGDLFVIRNAGNIISDYEIGSVEYAVQHLQTSLIVVLGYTQCGAVGAFIESKHHHQHNEDHIQKIIDYIQSEPEEVELNETDIDYYEKAINANIVHAVNTLKYSEPILAELIKSKKLKIVGALFDIETGEVKVIN